MVARQMSGYSVCMQICSIPRLLCFASERSESAIAGLRMEPFRMSENAALKEDEWPNEVRPCADSVSASSDPGDDLGDS